MKNFLNTPISGWGFKDYIVLEVAKPYLQHFGFLSETQTKTFALSRGNVVAFVFRNFHSSWWGMGDIRQKGKISPIPPVRVSAMSGDEYDLWAKRNIVLRDLPIRTLLAKDVSGMETLPIEPVLIPELAALERELLFRARTVRSGQDPNWELLFNLSKHGFTFGLESDGNCLLSLSDARYFVKELYETGISYEDMMQTFSDHYRGPAEDPLVKAVAEELQALYTHEQVRRQGGFITDLLFDIHKSKAEAEMEAERKEFT